MNHLILLKTQNITSKFNILYVFWDKKSAAARKEQELILVYFWGTTVS